MWCVQIMSPARRSGLHWALRGMDAPEDPAREEDYDICAICHDSLAVGSSPIGYPCGHSFHFVCLSQYISTAEHHVKCPLCMQACPVLDLSHQIILSLRRENERLRECLAVRVRREEEEEEAHAIGSSVGSSGSGSDGGWGEEIPSPPILTRSTMGLYALMPLSSRVSRNLMEEFNST